MRVCIIRNNEASSNAGIIRVTDALLEKGFQPFILSRYRFNKQSKRKIIKKFINLDNYKVPNYEIQFQAEMGKGVQNIFQLVMYQYLVFKWLIKNRKDFDTIHAFDLDAGLPTLIATLILRKKIVYHIADFYVDSRHGIPEKAKKIVKWLEFQVISSANATIICTEERIKQIKGSKPKNLTTIHNSPVEYYKNNSDLKIGFKKGKINSITLCYVGSLTESRFINGVINVISNNPNYELNIAGLGPLDNHIKQHSKNTSNITYFGRIGYSDALNLYSNCDVMFALYDPSITNHRYSAPNKVYEAMMLGKPIIVAKGSGIDKLVEKEKMGLAINYSEEEFIEALDYIRTNPSEAIEMGRNARNAFESYSWPKMKKELQNLYDKI
jgi:glycosyltransferase involved in cell wall biosynthesis